MFVRTHLLRTCKNCYQSLILRLDVLELFCQEVEIEKNGKLVPGGDLGIVGRWRANGDLICVEDVDIDIESIVIAFW